MLSVFAWFGLFSTLLLASTGFYELEGFRTTACQNTLC